MNIKKKDIIKLIKYIDKSMIVDDYDETLDRLSSNRYLDRDAENLDDGTRFAIYLIVEFFKDNFDVDLMKDIKKYEYLNYNKVEKRALESRKFSDMMLDEFGWSNPSYDLDY